MASAATAAATLASNRAPIRVLLTNDDGFSSEGIACVTRALARNPERYDVRLASPSCQKSGVSHCITIFAPVYAERYQLEGELAGLEAWKVEGTPADCVKVALTLYSPWVPQLVISGCNAGLNAGLSTFYSGTCGAAMEAILQGIPAVAFSMDMGEAHADSTVHWETAERVIARVTHAVVENGLTPRYALNCNIPNLPPNKLKGVRVTHQGLSGYEEAFVERPTEENNASRRKFVLRGVFKDRDNCNLDYDAPAVMAGYAAVTPLSLNWMGPDYNEKWSQISQWVDVFNKTPIA